MKMLGRAIQPSVPYFGRKSVSLCFQKACSVPKVQRKRWRMSWLGGFRRFGPGDGFFVVADAPAEAANRDGEVGVFGDGVGGDSAGGCDGFFAPGAERAGNHGDAIEQIESALLHILTGDVFERLPAGEPARAVADFYVAGDGAEFRIGEMAHEFADRVGLDFGVGVDGDDDFGVGFGHRVTERGGFAAIDLMNDADARLVAEIRVEQFAGAVGGAVIHDDDVEILEVGSEHGSDGLHDDGFFVVRGDEHGDAGRRSGHHRMVGAQLFDQREDADDERAAADEHDAEDEDGGDAGAQPAINAEDKAVGASLRALHRR